MTGLIPRRAWVAVTGRALAACRARAPGTLLPARVCYSRAAGKRPDHHPSRPARAPWGPTASHSPYARADWGRALYRGLFHSFTHLTSTAYDPPAMARSSKAPSGSPPGHLPWPLALSAGARCWRSCWWSIRAWSPTPRRATTPSATTRTAFPTSWQTHGPGEQNPNWRKSASSCRKPAWVKHQYHAEAASSPAAPYRSAWPPGKARASSTNTPLPSGRCDDNFRNLGLCAAAVAVERGLQHQRRPRPGSPQPLRQQPNPRLGAVYNRASSMSQAPVRRGIPRPVARGNAERLRHLQRRTGRAGQLHIGSNFRIPNFNPQPEKARTLSAAWDWRPHAQPEPGHAPLPQPHQPLGGSRSPRANVGAIPTRC